MSTETLVPISPTPEQSRNKATSYDRGFVEDVLENQAVLPERKSRRKPVVDHIDPRRVPVNGGIDLEHILIARQALTSHEANPKEFPATEEELLEELMSGHDPESPAYDRQRHEIHELLTAGDKKFAKKSRQLEMYQARRDGVKLVRPEAEKTEKGSARLMPKTVERLMDARAERKNHVTEKELRRDIKAVDRHFGGLLGEVAETGTKSSYLDAKYDEYSAQMEAHGANVNGKTRRSIERETVRKLMNAEDLADRQGLKGDERREYIDGLVDTFHDYVTLDDTERERFNQTLAARQEAAKLLTHMERENAATTDREQAEKEPRESRRSRLIRSLGSTAAGVVAASRNRWEARNTRTKNEDEQPGLFNDKPYRKKGKLASTARSLANKPNELYHNANARLVESRRRREEKLAAMSDDEREAYENKNRRNRRAILAVGGAALAITAVALATKYGIDHWGNDTPGANGGGGFADLDRDGIPDSIDADRGTGSANDRTPTGPTNPESTPGNGNNGGGDTERLTRQELFDGRGGSRSLGEANVAELREFMADYKVKANDDQGVWGISEKYLNSKGIANPTVYEIDAVKDYILNNSSLSNSSIIYPGDTIKLR